MKKITFFITMMLLLCFSAQSQVQVGSGSNTAQYLPINPANDYTYSQSIYLASEINASGLITSIQWYYNGSAALSNSQPLDIYIGQTTKSSFSSSYDWEPIANLKKVYTGGLTTNSTPGWKTITLSPGFQYDGVSNLIIATDENTATSDTGTTNKFWNFQVTDNRSIGYYSNSLNPDPNTPPTTGGGIGSFMVNFVPDIIFGGINQTCLTPYYFSVSNILSTSATISWQPSATSPSGGSDYYVSSSNTTPDATTIPTGSISSGVKADLSGLLPNTKYYVWVRNNCGSSVYSAWSEINSFTTSCSPIEGFSENFDTTTAPSLPVCWSKIFRGPAVSSTAAIQTQSNAAYANSGSNSVSIYNSNSSGSYDIILVSPNLSTLGGNYRLKFYAQGDVSIDVGTLNSNLNDANYTALTTITSTTTMQQYVVDFTSYHGTDTYIGLRLNTSSQFKTVYLDDIQWEVKPICDDVTQISVPSVTSTGATINWLQGGTEGSWDVVIGTSDVTDPTTLIPNNTTLIPYSATGLAEATDYKVWIRSVCTGGNGVWVGPVSFKTDCASIATFAEGFDTSTVPNLPVCWAKIVRGGGLSSGADVKTIASDYVSQPNSLYFSNTTSTGEFDIIAVSPNLSTLATGGYRLKFSAKGPGNLDIGTLDSNAQEATFTNLATLDITDTYQQYSVEFTYPSMDTHVGIRLSTPDQNNKIFVDDVVWELIPVCPDVTQVKIQNVTDSTATFTWQDSGTETKWDIAVGLSTDSDPSVLPFDTTDTKDIFTKTGLLPLTNYRVWVRSACGTDNKGSWIGPVPFTTNCSIVESFSENFDAVTVPNLPSCWTKILRGSTLTSDAYVATNNTDFDNTTPNWVELANKSSSGSTYDVILVSPPVSTLTLGTYRLRFKAKRVSEHVNLQIGTLDDNSITGNFSVLTTQELTTDYVEYKIYFSAFNGTTDQFIGLRLNATDGFKTIKIDDIYWEPAPLCSDVDNVAVIASTTNSATITWNVIGTETNWDVVVGPDATTDPNTLAIQSSTVNSIEFTGLAPATVNYVWVRANCGHTTGAWIGPVRFNTDCLPVETFSEDFNITPYPFLPACWNQIIRNAAPLASCTNSLQSPLAAHSKPGFVTIYGGSPAVGDVILVGPSISTLNQAASYQLSFYATGSNTLEVGTLDVYEANTAVFTKVAEVDVHGVNGNDNNSLHIVDMSTAKATDHYIGFRIQPGSGTQSSDQYISMDDIQWSPKLGNEQFDLSRFSYYPNPVKDVMNISYSETINSVVVYNTLGQEVLIEGVNDNQARIDMSELPKGPYIVKVASDNAVKGLTIIKE